MSNAIRTPCVTIIYTMRAARVRVHLSVFNALDENQIGRIQIIRGSNGRDIPQ